MLFFLFSAFFMVSAGEDTVTGFVEDDVLLECNCSDRNLANDFKWQMEGDETKGTQPEVFFKYNRTSNVSDNQLETFIDKDSSNCSILLKNITLAHERRYRCSFFSGIRYTYVFVTLNICRRIVSQYSWKTSSGGTVYHCDVKLDCDRETEIQWTLNGTCLTNLSTSNSNGHHHFNSTLVTNSTFGTEPKCEVNPACPPNRSPITAEPQDPGAFLRTLCKAVPVVLVLGFLLIWCRCRGTSHRSLSEQDMENGDFPQTNRKPDEL